MNDDEDIPVPAPSEDPAGPPQRRTRDELDAMVETLWTQMQSQQAHIDRLQQRITALEDDQDHNPRLARWLPFAAPPAAEDKQHRDETPLFTIAHFVRYYNETYVGKPGSRAVAIPDCWLNHPALLAELATLTYTWRAAHIGKNASPRDAQYWHDRWRAGFAERLTTEWTHPHCLTDGHKPAGAPSRPDRFTNEQ
ncbi:hypothetical protein ABZ863_11185 [Saccharomonospora sp. NPDC046836]|uniref:hypothetical protein n=1 Tax=Saccharomonospora sp. NPDC046836 TaxID=3156921 RepID=UPI0033F139BB